MWAHSKGRALLLTAFLPSAPRHQTSLCLPADSQAHDLPPGSWCNGERKGTQPQHAEHPLKHGCNERAHEEGFHWQEGRENSSRQRHLCLLFNIRQQATGSSLFHFRTYLTCLHCNLVNNQLQVNFLCGLEE